MPNGEDSDVGKTGLFVRLKGRDMYETLENYSIGGVVFGALVASAGIALTTLSPKGIPAGIAMVGTLLSFLSAVSLVLSWLLKELFGK